MRICELNIKNFGKFKDRKWEISDGIHVFYGENESGKSTLHTFIKGMLFGMERKRGRAAVNDEFSLYEPWENPNYYSGILRFESGGKIFCIRRNFDKVSRKTELVCEEDAEELSVENGDLDVLLGGLGASGYDNTISVGQLKAGPDRSLAAELRNFAANYYAAGSADLDLEKALRNLQERKKEAEKNMKTILEKKQRAREKTEQEASYVWREIHRLQEEKDSLEEGIENRKKQEEKENVRKGGIDELRPEKWRIHPMEIISFLMFIIIPFFLIPDPWNYLVAVVLFLCCGIYVWNRMKVSKKQEKTEPERILEEIMPEEEKASIEKLIWERNRVTEELNDKQIQYSNLEEQIEEMDETGEEFKEQEKRSAAIDLAMQKLNDLSEEFQNYMEYALNKRVSEIVCSITDGRYSRLAVEDSLNISLICDGRKIGIEQVSRGTIEQIYFALRMAVSELLYEEELPVILDDTFVWYDDRRLEKTLQWLAENKRQVLLFTCQKREEQALERLNIPYHKEVL